MPVKIDEKLKKQFIIEDTISRRLKFLVKEKVAVRVEGGMLIDVVFVHKDSLPSTCNNSYLRKMAIDLFQDMLLAGLYKPKEAEK